MQHHFIHIEASSIQPPAFPVEVYWGEIPSEGSTGYLVNPKRILRWSKWNNEFFRKHGISEAEVQSSGTDPSNICDAIVRELSNKTVYSMQPHSTLELLTELFLVAERPICELKLLDLEQLFLQSLSISVATEPAQVLAQIRMQVGKEYPHYLSGGSFEVLYYSEILRRIC